MAARTNLYFRRTEREDLDTVVEWMQDPDFLHFLYGDPARSPKQVREQIVTMLGRSPGNAVPTSLYLLLVAPDEGPVGLVSLQNISWRNRSTNLDFYIGRKEWRGTLLTAVGWFRAVEYCFDELNLHRVNSYVYAFNRPSWRILERSGAKRELVLKEHVSRNGELHDMYGYGLLREDFEALRSSDASFLKGRSLSDMVAERLSDAEAGDAGS
jgi:RimJ/RimL family protein N-acetyltransferase